MAHKLKIVLNGSMPKIYRNVVVPENFTFEDLHYLIQFAFGWDNSHLHEFSFGTFLNRTTIAPDDDEQDHWSDEPNYDEMETTINDILPLIKNKINYTYDFGDDWDHTITFLKKPTGEVLFPMCIKGEGHNMIDDCGGIWEFYNMIEILQSKSKDLKEQKEAYREWLGLEKGETYETFYTFDIDETNQSILNFFNE